MSIVGMTSLPGMAASQGAFSAIEAELTAFLATNTAAGMSIMPPGMEGASAFAMAQQQANLVTFATNALAGITAFQQFIATVGAATTATEITDLGSAARMLAIA